MSGEGSPERGGGGSRGRQARRSTPWSNASRWPARRCEQRLSRSGIGGASLRAQAIEQYWRLGALRRSRSGDFLSHSRSWQMSSRDETVRLGLARFLSGWRPCELNMEDSSRDVAIVPALDGWAVGHGSRKFVAACGSTTASRIRIPLAVCKS